MTRRIHAARYVLAAAIVLACAGIGLMIALTSGDALLVGLAWALASVVVAALFAAARSRVERVGLGLTVVVACVLLGWVGGLFMIPAAVLLLAVAIADVRHRHAAQVAGGGRL